MRDLKYIIKRIIILTGVAILVYLFKAEFSFAMANNYSIYINNSLLNYNTKVFTPAAANVNVRIQESSNATLDYSAKNYGYIAFCSAFGGYDDRYIDSLAPGNMITDLRVVNSTSGCTIPNKPDYKTTARVVYFTFRVNNNNINCGASGPCGFVNPVTFQFYQHKTNEFSLVSYGFSYDEYNFTSEINPLVSQFNQLQSSMSTFITQSQQQHNEEMTKLEQLRQAMSEEFSDSDSNEIKSWLGNFDSDTYGLTDIITIPLTTIESISTTTCSTPLSVPIPFMPTGTNFELPCMTPIYEDTFGSVFTMYQTITTALIGYWCIVRMFAIVKGIKDPNDDKIEVVDL